MTPRQSGNKQRTGAVFKIIAGVLFFVAAFSLLAGRNAIGWFWVVAGVLFVAGGVWALKRSR